MIGDDVFVFDPNVFGSKHDKVRGPTAATTKEIVRCFAEEMQ